MSGSSPTINSFTGKTKNSLLLLKYLILSVISVLGFWSSVFPQIHKDSSLIVGWATNVTIDRGYINISDTSATDQGSNRASLGEANYATGKADGSTVSLGDGGTATYAFDNPLSDKPGPDFAVFENGFKEQMPPNLWFLELAVVEVSSNGIDFVRFPSISSTQTENQIATYGQLDPSNLHNLAGKYTLFYGTPFDLEELKDSVRIDIQNITQIRVIDVVGSLNERYGTKDSQGHLINDPFPTPFWSGGFDLDALAILGSSLSIAGIKEVFPGINVYPNPVFTDEPFNIKIEGTPSELISAQILNLQGQVMGSIIFDSLVQGSIIGTGAAPHQRGIYFLLIQYSGNQTIRKIVVQ